MILKKFLSLINLIKIENFYIHKIIKYFVIYKTYNFIFIIFKLILLNFKNFNNN